MQVVIPNRRLVATGLDNATWGAWAIDILKSPLETMLKVEQCSDESKRYDCVVATAEVCPQ